jgi:hypothetical protein
MIYLIDDNQNNQRIDVYKISFIEDGLFSKSLIAIDKIPKSGGAKDIHHLTFLNNAACVLIHSTTEDTNESGDFISGSNSNVIKIIEEIAAEGSKIPLVLFSNKMDEIATYDYNINPNYISAIKKNKFYERLYDFVEHYQINKDIELRIIAYGKNFISQEVTALAQELLKPIAFENDFTVLKLNHIAGINIFRKFIEMADLQISFDDVLYSLEDSPITIQDYRDRINLITESFTKYGRNIHHWQ